jgi:F-type H+-transporting ATPase subunit gamma
VVITTDKGLVGGFNDSVLHQAEKRMQQLQSENIHVDIVTVGRKAKEHFDRQGITSAMHLEGFGDYTEFEDTRPIAEAVLTAYKNKTWDAVYISYTHFRTTLKQENVEHQLLPASESSLENIIKDILPEYGRFSEETYHQQATASQYSYTYTFEPKPEKIISQLVENLLRISMHHIMLESNASEHSSRMVTMKNARDNAEELQEDLSLEFNKLRQASITAEISEIVAGAEALQ